MTYAQISKGIVENIILLDDASLIPKFSEGFDALVLIDNIVPIPQLGWLYDGFNFTSPQVNLQALYQSKIQNAIDGFNTLMLQYVASNVIGGITQAGKTELIADALQDVQRYGQSGSLYAAITALKAVPLTPEMDPFLNQSVVDNLVSQTLQLLASL